MPGGFSHYHGGALTPITALLGYDAWLFRLATFAPDMKPILLPHLLQHRVLAPALLACAMVLACPVALSQTNAKAAGFYEDALARFDKKDMPGAIIQLKNALQIDPSMLSVQLLLGKALLRNGEVAAAEVAFNEALRLGVNRAEVVLLLGQTYMAQGKHNLVLEQNLFKPAGLPPAVQLQLRVLLASIYGDLGEPAKALREVDEARAIDSGNPDVWLAEIPIRIRARQFREASVASDKALSLAPNSPEAWYQRGSIDHVQGRLRDALTAYDRALKIDTAHIEARVARLGIAVDQGRYDDASKDVAELQNAAPQDPRGAYMKALLSERNGQIEVSRAALKEVTDLLDPVPIAFIRYRSQLLMLNGLAHFGLNQGEKAKQYLEAFQRVAKPVSPMSKLLARIYLADGNAAQAIKILDPYLRAQPGDGQALTLLATANMALGRHSKATALMQDALKTQDNPAYRTALGLSLVGDGQMASGLMELEASYRKDPRQVQAATALIQLYLRSNQARKAVPIAEQLVKTQGAEAGYHNLLGMALGQASDLKGARAAFEKALSIDPNQSAAKLNLAKLEIVTRAYGRCYGQRSGRHPQGHAQIQRCDVRTGHPRRSQGRASRSATLARKSQGRCRLQCGPLGPRVGRVPLALRKTKCRTGRGQTGVRQGAE